MAKGGGDDDAEWRPSMFWRLFILIVFAFIGAGTNLFIAASHKIEEANHVRYLFISVTLLNESLKFVVGTLLWITTSGCSCS